MPSNQYRKYKSMKESQTMLHRRGPSSNNWLQDADLDDGSPTNSPHPPGVPDAAAPVSPTLQRLKLIEERLAERLLEDGLSLWNDGSVVTVVSTLKPLQTYCHFKAVSTDAQSEKIGAKLARFEEPHGHPSAIQQQVSELQCC